MDGRDLTASTTLLDGDILRPSITTTVISSFANAHRIIREFDFSSKTRDAKVKDY